MDVTPVVSQIVPSSIEIYNTTSSHVETSSQPTVRGVVSSNTTGNEVVAITTTLPVSAGNLTAMPNIEQWFTTVNQVCLRSRWRDSAFIGPATVNHLSTWWYSNAKYELILASQLVMSPRDHLLAKDNHYDFLLIVAINL